RGRTGPLRRGRRAFVLAARASCRRLLRARPALARARLRLVVSKGRLAGDRGRARRASASPGRRDRDWKGGVVAERAPAESAGALRRDATSAARARGQRAAATVSPAARTLAIRSRRLQGRLRAGR